MSEHTAEIDAPCRGCTIDDREPHTCAPPAWKLTAEDLEALADAFVAANRAEFLDYTADGVIAPDDPDLPILRAVEHIVATHVIPPGSPDPSPAQGAGAEEADRGDV